MGAAQEDKDAIAREPAPATAPVLDEAQAGLRLAEELLAAGDLTRSAEAYLYAAGIMAARGQTLEAVGVGYRALQLEPRAFARLIDSDLLLSLGDAVHPLLVKALEGFEAHLRWTEAAMVGRKLISLRRDDVDIRLRVANVLGELGNNEDALDLLWEITPLLEHNGNNAALLELLPRVLEFAPDHPGAQRRLMRLYLRVGELRACLNSLAPLVRIDDPDALEVLARVQTELGRDEVALDVLRRLSFVLIEAGQLEHVDRILGGAGRWSLSDAEFRPRVNALRDEITAGQLDRATAMRDEPIATALGAMVIEIELGIGASELPETPNP